MKIIHFVELRVFCKENEDEEKIKQKLTELVPFDLYSEKVDILEETVDGLEGNKFQIYKIVLSKSQHTKKFIKDFISKFSDKQIKLLKEQIESRLDEGLHFFIRLDKDKLLNDNISITDTGNCFHIRITLALYPAKREPALELINKILDQKV